MVYMRTIEIYKLTVIHEIEQFDLSIEKSEMLIGFFSSCESLNEAISDCRQLPGFSLPECKFDVKTYSVEVRKNRRFQYVYYVEEWIIDKTTGEERTSEIGVFLSLREAKEAKRCFINDKKLRNPDSPVRGTVYINKYLMDEREWKEGFVIDDFSWKYENKDGVNIFRLELTKEAEGCDVNSSSNHYIVGCFESEEACKRVIKELRKNPEFVPPKCRYDIMVITFEKEEYPVDTVYCLFERHFNKATKVEIVKEIDDFTTSKEAEEARLNLLRKKRRVGSEEKELDNNVFIKEYKLNCVVFPFETEMKPDCII